MEILLGSREYSDFVVEICAEYGVHFKMLEVSGKYQVYLKDGEEISRFLALIGANRAVMRFEDIRVLKDMKNSVNRKVNCEAANLSKTIDAAIRQIDDINRLKEMKKFKDLPSDLQQVANLRLENPDLSLKDLGELMMPPLRQVSYKSQVYKNT